MRALKLAGKILLLVAGVVAALVVVALAVNFRRLLAFGASTGGPCNAEAPRLENDFWQKYGARGLQVIGVNVEDEAARARRFRERHSLSYPVLLDVAGKAYYPFRRGDLADALVPADFVATPFNLVIDRQGVVRYRGLGFEEAKIRALIEELLG